MEALRSALDRVRAALAARTNTLAWVLVVMTILLVPTLLVGIGYYPTDDCLRHAAKAVDGRPWADILVLRPGLMGDPAAPWHALLRAIHLGTGMGTEGLVVLAVTLLFILVLLAPLPWLKAPEAWLGAWVLAWIAGGGQMRLLLGRPFLFAMAVLVTLMTLWTRDTRLGPALRRGLTLALFAGGALLHGSWYLLALIPVAFMLARRWRDGVELLLAWAVGCCLAALVTGHPVQFLGGELLHVRNALGPHANVGALVVELGPSMGSGVMGIFLLGVLLLSLGEDREDSLLRDPVFLLALLAWLLGLKVQRFWSDWGFPCTVLWLAFKLEPRLLRLGKEAPLRRLALAASICLATLLLVTTADERRWADRTEANSIVAERQDLRGWLPEEGGILYAANMGIFYDTYYRNPHARWRYVLGFEPTMMPPADLDVYDKIVRSYDDPAVFAPWLAKMGPKDRLAYFSPASPGTMFPELQWFPVGRNLWLGRKGPVGS